ncbi:MAG: TonB family protein [Kiritimatiellae bacterium]|nr:TonB family protein [Kiritimatiellia bacterium]
MNGELKKKGVISIAVHLALLIFLVIRSFISCHRLDARNISPFIDLQVGAVSSPAGGGGAPTVAAAANVRDDDAFPEPARKKKGQVEVSRKLVRRPVKTAPAKKMSENELKRALSAGIDSAVTSPAGAGPGTGTGAGGIQHPYAWYYKQVYNIMYAAWQQPSSLIGVKGLVTRAEIRIQRGGRVAAKRIVRPSGNRQMDESVMQALESVNVMPELPAGFGGAHEDIFIDFELADTPVQAGE